MILDILYHHLAVILVFLMVAASAWLYGGTRPAVTMAILPWFMALTLEAMLFFPQRRPYEDIMQARGRLWRKIVYDPVFYLMLAFIGLLVIPFFNRGLCPNCDVAAIAAGADPEPFFSFLPFCVNVKDHSEALAWFVPAFVAALAVRHALVREGKRIFVEMVVWNAVILAVFGFVEQASGARFVFWEKPEHPTYFFSTFGYPNAAGAFFAMMYAFSIGLWRYHAKETDIFHEANRARRIHGHFHYWLRAHYMLVATVLLLFAVLYTRSRAAIMIMAVASALGAMYVVAETLGRNVARARRLKTIAFSSVGMFVIGFSVLIFAPKSITDEMKGTDLTSIADRMTGKTEWHMTAATEIFKEHSAFGVGCWGYKHLCLPYVPESARRSFGQWYSHGGANVHNDFMQFLCEHGAVCVALLLAMVVFTLWPVAVVWSRLYQAARFMRPDKAPPKPKAIFVLPAGTFWILVGNLGLCVHAMGDCPMRGTAVLTAFFATLAAAEGFIPRQDEIELPGETVRAEMERHGDA